MAGAGALIVISAAIKGGFGSADFSFSYLSHQQYIIPVCGSLHSSAAATTAGLLQSYFYDIYFILI